MATDGEKPRSFLQVFILDNAPQILTGIGVVLSGFASWNSDKASDYASEVQTEARANQLRLDIRQLRLDENTLIAASGGSHLPIDIDRIWQSYENCRNTDHGTRKQCSSDEINSLLGNKTEASVAIPLPKGTSVPYGINLSSLSPCQHDACDSSTAEGVAK